MYMRGIFSGSFLYPDFFIGHFIGVTSSELYSLSFYFFIFAALCEEEKQENKVNGFSSPLFGRFLFLPVYPNFHTLFFPSSLQSLN